MTAHCLHCQHRKAGNGCRGLCVPCHKKPRIRRKYPTRRPRYGDGPLCIHCRDHKRQIGKRGLCYACYHDPDIRPKYAPAFVAKCVAGASNHKRSLPVEPTDTPIGSDERIAVYAERVKAGVGLYHPADSKAIVPPNDPPKWVPPEDHRPKGRMRMECLRD